jgi:hypothetical protein
MKTKNTKTNLHDEVSPANSKRNISFDGKTVTALKIDFTTNYL